MTPQQMETKVLSGYAALTGPKRVETILYHQRAAIGIYGPVSQSGANWCRRVLAVMGATS